ncbi:unnamed protein product, partial [Rotaria sp. Silwood1]
DIVRSNFANRSPTMINITTGTCYSLLPNCDRGPWPLCLDWREICDQKIDCLNGEDEMWCQVLEITKCAEDEYQCHYGGQCIPLEFLRDSRVSVDCLDASDEPEFYVVPLFPSFNWNCINIPTFQCEERTARYGRSFPCGDGEYILRNIMPAPRTYCQNQRDKEFTRILLTSLDFMPDDDCRHAFFCSLHANRSFGFAFDYIDVLNIERIFEGPCEPLAVHCRTEWVFLPHQPIFFGLFQLLYFTNRSVIEFQQNIAPDLICFRIQQCPALYSCTVQLRFDDGIICCRADQLLEKMIIYDFNEIFTVFVELYYYCTTRGIDRSCVNASFFHCEQSLKCIAIHRVADGFPDCFYGEDENFSACHLNDSHRFVCLSNSTKCLSPVTLGNKAADCPDSEDEQAFTGLTIIKHIPFAYVCDDWIDYRVVGQEETDETHCEWWPCNNVYVRCNKHWDCMNGIDELGCSYSHCALNEHLCQDTINNGQLYCLPLEYIFETYLDPCVNPFYHRVITFENRTDLNNTIAWKKAACITNDMLCRRHNSSIVVHNETCLRESALSSYSYKAITFGKNTIHQCSFFVNNHGSSRSPFFNPSRLGYVPSISTNSSMNNKLWSNQSVSRDSAINHDNSWFCHRGILVKSGANHTHQCLCPPSYYGTQCQWQSQRVSLTLQLVWRSLTVTPMVFRVIIMLVDQFERIAPNHEQITFIPTRDCRTKFNIYLLYPDRPKNTALIYSIHIDIFELTTMIYWASWFLPITFPFLPVNRVVSQLFIPDRPQVDSCSLSCEDHGRCVRYINQKSQYFCQCNPGYSGSTCHQTHMCHCSDDSICLSPTICVCPLNKFGSQCYLKRSICHRSNNPCQNQGHCVPSDDRIDLQEATCLCTPNYSGLRCEFKNSYVKIQMKDSIVGTDLTALIHIITAFHTSKHERTTVFKKITFDQHMITLYISQPFHIIFVELAKQHYYLAVVRQTFIASEFIHTVIGSKQRCAMIDEVLNSTFLAYESIRRIKYYPYVCRENPMLMCFYDEIYMCICDLDRFANCFDFYQDHSYNCQGFNDCENGGQCFQNNETCPTMSMCLCPECFYGTKCQFSTKAFTLTLDPILGYHIKPYIPFSRQPSVVKFSTIIITIMSIVGFISGFLSIWIFRTAYSRETHCRYYLIMSSTLSMCTIIMLAIKCWLLIFSQMALITNRLLLSSHCHIIDVLLKVFLASGEWLNTCITVDRTWTLRFGVTLDENKKKRTAKLIIFGILLFTSITHLHDPFHRQLIDDFDADEERIWCFVRFSPQFEIFNSFITLFHVLVPFSINFISAIVILVLLARTYSHAQPEHSFQQHLRQQCHLHNQLLYPPFILVILGLPRLIIAFMNACMKSGQHTWLFLFGYLLAFVPSTLTFVIFILTPKVYRRRFHAAVQRAL